MVALVILTVLIAFEIDRIDRWHRERPVRLMPVTESYLHQYPMITQDSYNVEPLKMEYVNNNVRHTVFPVTNTLVNFIKGHTTMICYKGEYYYHVDKLFKAGKNGSIISMENHPDGSLPDELIEVQEFLKSVRP